MDNRGSDSCWILKFCLCSYCALEHLVLFVLGSCKDNSCSEEWIFVVVWNLSPHLDVQFLFRNGISGSSGKPVILSILTLGSNIWMILLNMSIACGNIWLWDKLFYKQKGGNTIAAQTYRVLDGTSEKDSFSLFLFLVVFLFVCFQLPTSNCKVEILYSGSGLSSVCFIGTSICFMERGHKNKNERR